MDHDVEQAVKELMERGVSVGFFTMHQKPGWHCQLSQVAHLKFTNGEGLTLKESLDDAKQKLDKIWAAA